MEIDKLFTTGIGELTRMLNSKTVVGDPIQLNGATVVPLVSIGFGFGAGEGEGSEPSGKGSGHGGGTGGGGGIKPVAVLVADKDGVRLESIKGAGSVFGKVAEAVTELARGKTGGKASQPKTEA